MPKHKRTQHSDAPSYSQLAATLIRVRATRALDKPAELERQAKGLVEQLQLARSGEKQRNAGRASPGRRGKFRRDPSELRAAVLARHQNRPDRTFNDVCREVARKFGYAPSAKAVKKAAADVQWPDPRRLGK